MAYNPMDYVHNVPTKVAAQIAAINRPRGGGGDGGGKRGPVSQTLQQVANRRVNQQLNPQIAAQNAFDTRQANVIRQFANALLGKLQPVAGQVGADYDQAIKQIGSLSGQAAQYFSGQNPDASQQQLLSSVGAPPEQQAQATQALGDTFKGGAGVLAYTSGTIPGSQLATNKAAAQAQAAQLPGIAALKGQQDLASALWQQGQDRRQLLATRPALLQRAEQDIRTNNAARANLAQKQAAAKFLNWYRQNGIKSTYTQGGYTYGVRADGSVVKMPGTQDVKPTKPTKPYASTYTQGGYTYGIKPDGSVVRLPGAKDPKGTKATKVYSSTYQQGGYTYGIKPDGSVVRLPGPRGTGSGGRVGANPEYPNLTKAQVLHLRSGIAQAFNGIPEHKDPKGKVVPALPPVDYQTAINEAISAGYSRAGATKMANRFYMPGKRGRPPASATAPTTLAPGLTGPVGT